eukprot:evm.model.scf_71.7 EVM.evm.TU.scf_71.7   scf_71:93839-95193(+)
MATFEELSTGRAYLPFDTAAYPFLATMQSILGWQDLEQLHESLPDGGTGIHVTFENDQRTPFHLKFYESPELMTFEELYHKFVREQDDYIVYQKRPTFRVCLPNNVAVGQRHRDGDYNHPPGEINFWMPFTRVWDSNGMYVESQPDKGDFQPVQCEYGQMFRFYGNRCWHYNELNKTGITRVSVDFRVIPGSMWQDPGDEVAGTVKSGLKMNIGGYYADYRKPGV